ncbi:MAG TPA: hypothetical protein VGJ48_25815 [Pyrinomonadaceae bacterium]|jgi:hypothetical protein
MEKQGDAPKSIGQAIDQIIHALSSLDDASRVTAIRAACEHLKIKPPESLGAENQKPPAGGDGAGSLPLVGSRDIKELKAQKNPYSANEMAAVVAFYLSEIAVGDERKTEVDLEDMVKYFKQAIFPLPKKPQMLMTNAKNAGYFDSAERGKFKLNPVGYNLVAHNLPRSVSGAAKSVKRNKRPKRTKRAGKTRAR